MTEAELREITHKQLLARRKQFADHIIFDEYRIRNGLLRPDIVAIGKKSNYCFELKAENDRDNRLIEQIMSYNTYFDKVYVVIDGKNPVINGILKEYANVEFIVAKKTGLKTVQRGSKNLVKNKLNILNLVTFTESVPQIAKYYGVKRSYVSSNFKELVNRMPITAIRNLIFDVCERRCSRSTLNHPSSLLVPNKPISNDDHYMEVLAKKGEAFDPV